MLARISLSLTILCLAPAAWAMPATLDLELSTARLQEALTPELRLTIGAEISASASRGRSAPAASGASLGLGLVGWLVSASVYGVCLTAGVPELAERDPAMALENMSRRLGRFQAAATSVPPWARSIARSLGVLNLSVGDDEASRGGRLELLLLPIGPERAAGLSISGCFG